MSSSSNRYLGKTALLAMAAFATVHAPISNAQSYEDLELKGVGEFAIGNGESKLIATHRTPEPYRVCVSNGPLSVPVSLRYDGQERTVAVGDCADVTAKHISLQPASRLKGDDVLVGKYEHRG